MYRWLIFIAYFAKAVKAYRGEATFTTITAAKRLWLRRYNTHLRSIETQFHSALASRYVSGKAGQRPSGPMAFAHPAQQPFNATFPLLEQRQNAQAALARFGVVVNPG